MSTVSLDLVCARIGVSPGRWRITEPRAIMTMLTKGDPMIFITAKFQVKPESAERWPEITHEFTQATRSEPGCLWFNWSRSLDDPTEYVIVEAFRDDAAGAAHVQSEHFATACKVLPSHLVETPRILNMTIPQDDWSRLGEFEVSG
jgi:quinol monooxygenase YgiN